MSGRSLRSITCVILIFLTAVPYAGAPIRPIPEIDRRNVLQSVTLTFALGDSVTFQLNGTVVTGITFHVLGADYVTPLTGCERIDDVQFQSARFSLGEPDPREEGTFSFLFRMGPEAASRPFEGLPAIVIHFRNKTFTESFITRATAAHDVVAESLCGPSSGPR